MKDIGNMSEDTVLSIIDSLVDLARITDEDVQVFVSSAFFTYWRDVLMINGGRITVP